MHIRLGHIASDAEYVPQQAHALPLHSDLPLYSLILESGDRGVLTKVQGGMPLEDDDEDGLSDLKDADCEDTTHSPEDDDVCYDAIFETLEDEELGDLGTGMLSKEAQLRILDRNTVQWKTGTRQKVYFSNLGRTCIGPGPVSRNLVFQPCPEGTTIDLDTTRLSRNKNLLRLGPRCSPCQTYYELARFFGAYDTEVESESTPCTYLGCEQPPFHGTGRCIQHLTRVAFEALKNRTAVNFRTVRKAFDRTTRKRWTFPSHYDVVRRRTEEIMEGKRPGSDLIILDDEFSPASGQLWEFAMIERVSGNVLINTIVDHPNGLNHNTMGRHKFLHAMSRSKARSVFAPSRSSDIDRMNVHEIASALQRVGISRDTIIISYHLSTNDLGLLRNLLESNGYRNLLPPDKNCIPFIHLLNTNITQCLSEDQRFPVALEVIFPLFYPRHHLVGLNHQALIDCQQTRLVCMAFDELCKPIAKRGATWNPDTTSNSAQRSIMDWLQSGPTVDNSNGTRKRRRDLVDDEDSDVVDDEDWDLVDDGDLDLVDDGDLDLVDDEDWDLVSKRIAVQVQDRDDQILECIVVRS
ncbi:hypothetical protein NM208_g8870 [Fusarium decemcellulare]|uniref:Uncharacterized protein n=1 Tax=Fusarium decemcellulare TaxID=57161 RepID=A0ACC1S3T5_9HYPO|nr:hypothetical protein NM208_g8870 [Fusarium decemcellulare]